ncbi:MAG: Holliday junction resolvase RuvX, partial [Caldilineaceae bacterium]
PLPDPNRLLALDVGLARIGVALTDPLGLAARPLLTLQRRSRNQDFDDLATLVTRYEVEAVVCGLALNMDGSEGPQAAGTRKWAMRLAQALRAILGCPLPIIFWDERLSSYTARELQGADAYADVGEDALAATVILQAYLDARRAAARGSEHRTFGRIDLPPRPPAP